MDQEGDDEQATVSQDKRICERGGVGEDDVPVIINVKAILPIS